MKPGLGFVVCVLLAAGCGPASPTPGLTSGIQGQVTLGPTCPVVQADSPCPDQPYQARLDIMDSRQSRTIVSIATDDQGQFRLSLPAGDFVLVPVSPSPSAPPQAQPVPFHLDPDEWLTLEVVYDSGIR